jgi:hypothetical protein
VRRIVAPTFRLTDVIDSRRIDQAIADLAAQLGALDISNFASGTVWPYAGIADPNGRVRAITGCFRFDAPTAGQDTHLYEGCYETMPESGSVNLVGIGWSAPRASNVRGTITVKADNSNIATVDVNPDVAPGSATRMRDFVPVGPLAVGEKSLRVGLSYTVSVWLPVDVSLLVVDSWPAS